MTNVVKSDTGTVQLQYSDLGGTIAGTSAFAGTATNGFVLQIVSGVPTWSSVSATNATNISGGAAGSLPYQTAASTTAFLAVGSNGNVLTLASGVPSWAAPAAGTSITTNTGLSTNVAATGSVTITNTGVTAFTSSSGLSTNTSATGAVSVTNTGVTSNVAGTGVSVSGATGAVTISIGQAVATSSTPTFATVTLGNSSCTIGAAPTTYSSTCVSGANGGYAGFMFTGTTNNRTFMVATGAAGISGMYEQATSAWDWYWTGGTLTVGTVPAANVSAGSFGSGACTFSSTVTATGFTVSSDRNKKDNIRTFVNAEEVVQSLRGVSFNWKEDGKPSVGVIAQEVEEVLPELVHTNDEGFKSVNYDGIIGVLVEAIKSLQKEVADLKSR